MGGRAWVFGWGGVGGVRVQHAKRRMKYGILFIFSLFCEYIDLEYVRIHVICRVNQAEYAIRIPMACATGIRQYLFNT